MKRVCRLSRIGMVVESDGTRFDPDSERLNLQVTLATSRLHLMHIRLVAYYIIRPLLSLAWVGRVVATRIRDGWRAVVASLVMIL